MPERRATPPAPLGGPLDAEAIERLEAFAGQFRHVFPRGDQFRRFVAYLAGLSAPGGRKTVRGIAALSAGLLSGESDAAQALQHFVAQSPWDADEVFAVCRRLVEAQPDPSGAWVVHDAAFVKRGRHSARAQRQFARSQGRKLNCQVAVVLARAGPSGYALLTVLNPAASVRGERYAAVEGKTPEIAVHQARALLAPVGTATLIGRRDKALLGVLAYTAARAGAVARLRRGDFRYDSGQYALRFDREKGGKSREIPVRHDLQELLLDYLRAAEPAGAGADAPLFPSAAGRTGRLAGRLLSGSDIHRVVKRRLAAAGLPKQFPPHSFRVKVATDLRTQGVPLDEVQSYCLPTSGCPGFRSGACHRSFGTV